MSGLIEAESEKHYRELIMLFTSWHDEQTDLLRNYTSFEEHYLARRDEISEQMQQYAVCSEDLNEIGHRLDDMYDTIAPVTQDAERQHQAERCTDTHRPSSNGQKVLVSLHTSLN